MSDADGSLYDAGVRTSMSQFASDTATFEAAAAVRTAYQAIERLRSHGTDSRGLSSGAMDLLLRLSSVESAPLKDLAGSAGVSARNVTGLIDTLERDGLVRRTPDPVDRRSVRAEITDAGRDWLESFRKPSELAMTALFHGFTPDELNRLRHLCLRLVQNQQHIESRLNPQ